MVDGFTTKFVRENVEHILLRCLSQNDMHGYALIQAVRKDYGVYLGPSTVYPALNKKLEPKGLVKSCWDLSGARPRKVYKITNEGQRRLGHQRTVIRQILSVNVS